MEARVTNGIMLKRIFDALLVMVDDVNIDCTSSGMNLQAMDGSHVALVILNLANGFFEKFSCHKDRTLGLSLTGVCKVFKLCGSEDSVTIRHEDESDTVTFIFEGANDDRVSDFDLKLINIESEHLGVPDTKFDIVLDMPCKQYTRICSELSQFTDTVSIAVTQRDVRFSCSGDIGRGSTTLKPKDTETEKVKLIVHNPVTLKFAARYLSYFAKSASIAAHMRLAMSIGSPLEITIPINDSMEYGTIKFYLAPKMDDSMDA